MYVHNEGLFELLDIFPRLRSIRIRDEDTIACLQGSRTYILYKDGLFETSDLSTNGWELF